MCCNVKVLLQFICVSCSSLFVSAFSMGAGELMVVALVWLCWVCHCSGLEVSSDDHVYKFDNNYIAMKKAAGGINIPNPDMLAIYGLEIAGLYYAATHKMSYLAYEKLSSNTANMYAAVLNGECIKPQPGDHGRCLTERESRLLVVREVRMALQAAATLSTEAGVRARLQWFLEGGVDDIVSIISSSAVDVIRDLFSALVDPIKKLWFRFDKLKSILVNRYTFGTGSADKLVWTADMVTSEVYAIIGAIIKNQYRVAEFYRSTVDRVGEFSVIFQDHLAAVRNLPKASMHRDSPIPFINRYWDARALEYAVTWIFKMRKEVRHADKEEFYKVLGDLYHKLVAGDTEEALELANHFLSKSMDMLGPKVFSNYLGQPFSNYVLGMSIPVPPNFEDMNPFGVWKSQYESEISATENLIHHYLDEAAEESLSRVLFDLLVSMVGGEVLRGSYASYL